MTRAKPNQTGLAIKLGGKTLLVRCTLGKFLPGWGRLHVSALVGRKWEPCFDLGDKPKNAQAFGRANPEVRTALYIERQVQSATDSGQRGEQLDVLLAAGVLVRPDAQHVNVYIYKPHA